MMLCIFEKKLRKKRKEKWENKGVTKHLDSQYKMALTLTHILAYMLHPKQKDAHDFTKQKYPINVWIPLINSIQRVHLSKNASLNVVLLIL